MQKKENAVSTGISIREIKRLGKEKFQRNNEQCILAELVPALVQIGILILSLFFRWNKAIMFILLLISVAAGILFEIGQTEFYIENSQGKASWKKILCPFSMAGYGMMETVLMKYAIAILYGLLLVIPGIIRGYSYGMVDYIVVSDKDYDWVKTLKDSRQIMNGHKKEYFKFRLSFYPLFIVSLFTFGIMYVLYVGPYFHQSRIELLENIRKEKNILSTESKEADYHNHG